jgi:myo-inositol 2-dehydrogenase/D-chiro-inositol 1-dehydrogenase
MRRYDPAYGELRTRVASGEIGAPLLAHCVHRNVSVPPQWTSEDIVFTSAVHEIDVMPWVFGREVVTVNWLSPIPAAPGVRRDPQVAILELEGGALIFVELFMAANYGYEIRCEIVGEKGTIELAPPARTVARSDLKVQVDLAADWRARFAEAYRREVQSWVNAILAWRSADLKSVSGPVNGPDAWDGYRAAVIAETLVASMSSAGPMRVKSLSIPRLYQQVRS